MKGIAAFELCRAASLYQPGIPSRQQPGFVSFFGFATMVIKQRLHYALASHRKEHCHECPLPKRLPAVAPQEKAATLPAELLEQLRQALPPAAYECVRLRHVEGMTRARIGRVIGLTPQGTACRLKAIYRTIRRKLPQLRPW
jgi:DNA-directed RNA polymerase specialized sigma24 family protein